MLADSNGSSLIFVHTHPHSLHPSKFSPIDELSNKRIFANLSQILTDIPLGSLVFSRRGVYGVVYNKGKINNITNATISGKTLTDYPVVESRIKSSLKNNKYDRQERTLGRENQRRLQEMIITIVGVGGTGSPLAVQLARMGIKRIRLIDKDIIDETNLPRVYGSKPSDVGRPKADVLKKYIESFSDTKVEAIQADITTDDVVEEIVDSDVIFSCTDNLASRAILNDVSIQYFIPLIDVGCRINLNKNKTINQAIIKVQVVTSQTACLWCSGTLDGKTIMQESLSSQEKKKLEKEGYYENIENQPSIISMTTMAASMAVNKLLNLLGVFGNDYGSLTQIELKDGFMLDNNPPRKENCVCQKRRGLATKRKIVNQVNKELPNVISQSKKR